MAQRGLVGEALVLPRPLCAVSAAAVHHRCSLHIRCVSVSPDKSSGHFTKMFSRYGRYRKARTYTRKRIGRQAGVSFLSMRSKARKAMDPPGSKRRKIAQFMSQNLSSSDEEKLGGAVNQGGPNAIAHAPASMVRFKDIGSTVFDYHHYTRRRYIGTWAIPGTGGASSFYSCNFTKGGSIVDIADLTNLYGRFRIPRAQWEFIPHFGTQEVGFPAGNQQCLPDIGVQTYGSAYDLNNPNATWAEMTDDTQTLMYKGNQTIIVNCMPLIAELTQMSVNSGSTNLYVEGEAPWIPTSNDPNFYCGQVCAFVPYGSIANYAQYYSVYLTVWADFDHQK